ncbi:MAG: hypothetical protein KDD50_08690 [Bdellovibrionales bacterium]|nr:hypothetical protein [Bdellovibrionales bacterium]
MIFIDVNRPTATPIQYNYNKFVDTEVQYLNHRMNYQLLRIDAYIKALLRKPTSRRWGTRAHKFLRELSVKYDLGFFTIRLEMDRVVRQEGELLKVFVKKWFDTQIYGVKLAKVNSVEELMFELRQKKQRDFLMALMTHHKDWNKEELVEIAYVLSRGVESFEESFLRIGERSIYSVQVYHSVRGFSKSKVQVLNGVNESKISVKASY